MSNDPFRDFELEQEQKLTGLGRVASRADDLDSELFRIEKEFYRVLQEKFNNRNYSSFLFSSSSSSTISSSSKSEQQQQNRAGINSVVPIQVKEESKEASQPYVGVGALSEINLVPKRNIGWASWNIFSNAVVCCKHSATCLISYPVRSVRESPGGAFTKFGAFLKGAAAGTTRSLAFLGIGFAISPLFHLPFGMYNNIRGIRNALTSDRTFDVYSGSYRPTNVEEDHRNYAALYSLEQRILTRGNRDHQRQKMFSDIRAEKFPFYQMMKDRLGSIGGLGPKSNSAGTSDESDFDFAEKKKSGKSSSSSSFMNSTSKPDETNYYRILKVAPTASEKQIKLAYGKLAKVFHPDIDPSPKARKEFDKITKAYQTLVNPQLRKAYDAGGAAFAEATAKNNSSTSSSPNADGTIPNVNSDGQNVIMHGTPMEVFQRIFGGTPFEQLIVGPHYRSMFHMRAQGLCRVNLHNYEVVETLRMLRLATFLNAVLDTYAMSDEALALFVLQELESNSSYKLEHVVAELKPHVKNLKSDGTTTASTTTNNNNPQNTKKSPPTQNNKDKLFSNNNKSSPESEDSSSFEYGDDFPSIISFRKRSKDYATRLSKCCFGKELLYEVGESYIINAKRYLGETAFWKPRYLVTAKTASGMGRLKRSVTGNADPSANKDPSKILSQEDIANFFSIEFDNVICNLHMITRFVAITAVRDGSVRNSVELALFPTFSSSSSNTYVKGEKSTQRADPDGSHAVCPKTLEKILSSSLSVADRSKLFLIRPRGGTSNPFKEIISILKQLPEKERNMLRDGVAKRVEKARLIALKELGQVFKNTGSPYKDKSLSECVTHIRDIGTTPANSNIPFPF